MGDQTKDFFILQQLFANVNRFFKKISALRSFLLEKRTFVWYNEICIALDCARKLCGLHAAAGTASGKAERLRKLRKNRTGAAFSSYAAETFPMTPMLIRGSEKRRTRLAFPCFIAKIQWLTNGTRRPLCGQYTVPQPPRRFCAQIGLRPPQSGDGGCKERYERTDDRYRCTRPRHRRQRRVRGNHRQRPAHSTQPRRRSAAHQARAGSAQL